MKPSKVVHLTSAHPRYDTRIFLKQCKSLAKARYDVSLIVADGKGDERIDDIDILDVGKLDGRLKRFVLSTSRVYRRASKLDADIYHLHDPELIPIGVLLLLRGKQVIFDAHEDVPKQLLSKPYLNPFALKLLSAVFALLEKLTLRFYAAIVTATPYINEKFLKINNNSVNVNNYPIASELKSDSAPKDKKSQVCYVGWLGHIRGGSELIRSLSLTKSGVPLKFAGTYEDNSFKESMRLNPGWQKLEELGQIDREGVKQLLGESKAGMVLFHPLPNHVDSQPNKFFEYMSAGLPVIASNFPLWKEIIEGEGCGVCVDPLAPNEIAAAIDYIIGNPELAAEMGNRGREAVVNKYNWQIEENKLLELYTKLTK